MTRFRHTLCGAGAVLILITGVASPARAAPTRPPLSAPALLAATFAAMQSSLHEVHATLTRTVMERGKTATLSGSAACRFYPKGSLQARFQVHGKQFSGSDIVPYDATFVLLHGHTWERSAGTQYQWQRADPNEEALAVYILCPMVPQFAARDLAPDVMVNVSTLANLRYGGTEQKGRFRTWHLQSVVTQRLVVSRRVWYVSHRRVDVFIDQSSRFLVRVVSDIRTAGSHEPAMRTRTVRAFSQFNQPFTIAEPRPEAD